MCRISEKYTNEQSKFMDVHGAQMHYRVEGTGEPIVLIHGAFSSLHTFDGWVDELKGDFQLIRYTMHGLGLTSSKPDNDYSMDSHINALRIFLDKLGVRKVHLAGSSLGGWLAWEFTLRYPERVSKLVLLDSAGFLDVDSIPLPFKMARTPFVGKAFKYVVRYNILADYIKQVYHKKDRVTDTLIDRYYELFTYKQNPDAFVKMVNSKLKDNTQYLKEIKAPTLIVWGEEDNWLPLRNAYRFQSQIPHSRLVIYKEMGHIPMEEAPHETAMDVRSFLKHNWN